MSSSGSETSSGTSGLELTLRMGMRRYTRRTNAVSTKVWNQTCAVNLSMFHYNFGRPHQTLTKAAHGKPTTPAMAAGRTDHLWPTAELVALL